MPRISTRLKEIRYNLIMKLWHDEVSAKEIGQIFGMTTSQVYAIIKERTGFRA
jgi:DNA-directed RNA polymerase specialized sigma subunit